MQDVFFFSWEDFFICKIYMNVHRQCTTIMCWKSKFYWEVTVIINKKKGPNYNKSTPNGYNSIDYEFIFPFYNKIKRNSTRNMLLGLLCMELTFFRLVPSSTPPSYFLLLKNDPRGVCLMPLGTILCFNHIIWIQTDITHNFAVKLFCLFYLYS